MKTCFKCKRSLPVDEFYEHPNMGDGHLGKCKDCTRRDVARHRREHLDEVRAYDRRRYREPERHARALAAQRRHDARNPDKKRARTAVGNAIRDGRLVRQLCEQCGNPRSEAHHDDYSKPLVVRWLCFRCHRVEHGALINPDQYQRHGHAGDERS